MSLTQVKNKLHATPDTIHMVEEISGHLDEPRLARLVDRFYDKVRVDHLLGPVFDAVVEDCGAHKTLMASFWATVALRAGNYRGNPLAKHKSLSIDTMHFQHWLALWRETAEETLDAEPAAVLIGYAERIGYGMQVGLALTGHLRGRESGIPIRSVQRQSGGCG